MFWCFYCWLRISKCRIGCNDLISWILANDNALTPTILSVEFMSLLSFTCQAWPSWKSRLHGFLTLLCCSCSVTLIIIFFDVNRLLKNKVSGLRLYVIRSSEKKCFYRNHGLYFPDCPVLFFGVLYGNYTKCQRPLSEKVPDAIIF